MRKIYSFILTALLLSTVGVSNAWGDDYSTLVVGCAADAANTYDAMKIYIDKGDNWGTEEDELSKATMTFEGKNLFVGSYNTHADKHIYVMTFKKFLSSSYVSEYCAYSGGKTYNYYTHSIYNYDAHTWYSQLTFSTSARFYFDATGWNESTIKLCIGHANFQKYYGLKNVENTKLYYGNPGDTWGDAMGIGVVGGTARLDEFGGWLTDVSANAEEFTGFRNYALTKESTGNAYLMINAGKTGQAPTINYNDSHVTMLNSTQHIGYKIVGLNGVYAVPTSGTAPATISIASYKFEDGTYDEVAESKISLAVGGSTFEASVPAARTATTVLSVGNDVVSGYEFVGWYDEAGNELASTTYYPTSESYAYAYFRPTTYTRTISSGNYGTICLPFSVAAGGHSGLTFYSIAYVDSKTTPTELSLTVESGDLDAGKPYIVLAASNDPVITCGSTITNVATGFNGLHGTFAYTTVESSNSENLYIISSNKVYKAGEGCFVNANRAFINMGEVPEKGASSAPGQRIVTMSFDVENTTDIEATKEDSDAVKYIKDGKLFILRNGIKYDVTGRVVK